MFVNRKYLRRAWAASVAILCAAVGVLTSEPVRAATPDDLALCQNEEKPAAERAAACTLVIDDKAQEDEIRAEAYLNRGIVASAEDKEDAAIVDYSDAIRLNPDYPIAYALRGISHAREGDEALAFADFAEALRLDPTETEALLARAELYLEVKDYDKAIADFTAYIALEPDDAEGYAGRGLALEAKGDKVKALADVRKALSLDLQNEDAGKALKRLGG